MALNPAELHALNARIGRLLDKHLAPIFKPGTQITFIARTPGNDEADVLVTTERDLNNLVALVLRSVGRAAVGHGVDTVPRINERPAPAAALASAHGVKGAPLIHIPKDSRAGKPPCGECHLQPGETCDICGSTNGVQGAGKEVDRG